MRKCWCAGKASIPLIKTAICGLELVVNACKTARNVNPVESMRGACAQTVWPLQDSRSPASPRGAPAAAPGREGTHLLGLPQSSSGAGAQLLQEVLRERAGRQVTLNVDERHSEVCWSQVCPKLYGDQRAATGEHRAAESTASGCRFQNMFSEFKTFKLK